MPWVGSWFSPEDPQQLLVAGLGRVEHDQHDLGVPGPAGADLLIGRIGGEAPGVAGGGGVDPLGLPELALGAPEAPIPNTARSSPSGNGGPEGRP